MCLVSGVGDNYAKVFPKTWPAAFPLLPDSVQNRPISYTVNKVEFDKLVSRVDCLEKLIDIVDQMKLDLEKAKQQDIDNGEPDCEMEDKVDLLKKIAKLVGVDLSSIWPEENNIVKII